MANPIETKIVMGQKMDPMTVPSGAASTDIKRPIMKAAIIIYSEIKIMISILKFPDIGSIDKLTKDNT
jgi:hypothetical protein